MTDPNRQATFDRYVELWRSWSATERARYRAGHRTLTVLDDDGVTTAPLTLPFSHDDLDVGQLNEAPR